jgi:hypothetical protein
VLHLVRNPEAAAQRAALQARADAAEAEAAQLRAQLQARARGTHPRRDLGLHAAGP